MKREVIEFLPQFVKDVVEAYEEVEGVSPEMTLPVMLAILSFACQAILDANPGKWHRSPLSLFVAVVAESGQRKSAVFDRLKQGIDKWEAEQVIQAKADATQYKVEMKQYEQEIKDRAKDKDTDWTTQPPLFEPQLPRDWKHKYEKFTTNGFIETLERIPHAFVVNTDAAEFFNSHAFQNKGTDVEITSVLAKLWSGEPVERNTGIDRNFINKRRVSALFMIQAGQAKFLKDQRFKDQGFTNRILISQPPSIDDEDESEDMFDTSDNTKKAKLNKAIDVFNERVYDLLKSTKDVKKNSLADLRQSLIDTSDKNELDLDIVKIDEEAQTVYNEVYQALKIVKKQKYYKASGFYEEYEQFINREFEHFARLATILTVSQFKDSMSIEDAWCGKMLKDEFVDQRQHLELDIVAEKSVIVTIAEDLYKKLKKWTKDSDNIPEKIRAEAIKRNGFTMTMLAQYSNTSYINAEGLTKIKVIDEMEMRKWITKEKIAGGGNLVNVVS